MALYATQAALAAYVADNADVALPGDEEAVQRLLERAERRVDLALGPWPVLSTGRKIDPASLDLVQRSALERATCAAAEHELVVGVGFLVGEEDYLPGEVSILRQPLRTSPRMLEELAGHGLVKRSGTVATPPETAPGPAPASLLGPYMIRSGVPVVGP